MKLDTKHAYGAAIMHATLVGLAFLFGKIALETAKPVDLLAHRFLASFIGIIILLLTKTVRIKLTARRFRMLLPLALFYPLLFFSFQTYGLMLGSSSEAGILQASSPVFVMLLASQFLGEKLKRSQKVSVVLSVVGVLYILFKTGSGLEVTSFGGIILLLFSVLAFAAYNVLVRKAVVDFSYWEITVAVLSVGFVVFTIVATLSHLWSGDFSVLLVPLKNPQYVMAVLYLGILSTLGTAMLYNFALSKLEASRVSVFGNLTTVISILAGIIFLNEQLLYYHILGSTLIIGGVVGTNLSSSNEKRAKHAQNVDQRS